VPKQILEFNQVFHALADPTRRAVIQRLGHGSASATELIAPFQMALPSFMQHLGVLEQSGLVTSSKTGRTRTYTLEPQAIQQAENWLSTQRQTWEKRLDQLDEYLLQQAAQNLEPSHNQKPNLRKRGSV
jgi:DNA-binding transcriptional ArsR family regulator